ncbi:MAG: hypothetical protein WBW32_18290 [Luteibacter sp.]
MDSKLWVYGRRVARARGRRTKNWELDFVRGMHQGKALQRLSNHLRAATGTPVRLTSIWMDKNAWVTWIGSSGQRVKRRELADMAVIVRQPHGAGMAEWLWLLQAKRTMHLLEPYGGVSSVHELELLHEMPKFSLLEGDGRSGRILESNIDLKKDFGVGVNHQPVHPWPSRATTPWTFLDFDADRRDAGSASAHGFSPVSARWLGTPAAPQNSWAEQWLINHPQQSPLIASYTACLLGIVSGMQTGWSNPSNASMQNHSFVPGAPVDATAYPEWFRLYQALMVRSTLGTNGHAKAPYNSDGSVIQEALFLATRGTEFLRLYEPHFKGVYSSDELSYWVSGISKRSGEIAFSGIHNQNELDALTRFDAIAERVSKTSQSAFETTAVPPDPPTIDIPYDEDPDDHDGGMQVLFVDLLRSAG